MNATSSIAIANNELAYLASLGVACAVEPPASKKARVSRIFRNDDVITVLTRIHAMREGAVNLKRFLALDTGVTVKAAHALGVDNGYLAYYVRNGLIAIGPSVEVAFDDASITNAILGC